MHVKVSDTSHVASGKKKKDVVLVDRTGKCQMCVVKNRNSEGREGKCYLLKTFVVWEYGSKFLSKAKEGCEVIEIKDIGETVDEEVLPNGGELLMDAVIVGISGPCLRCKA